MLLAAGSGVSLIAQTIPYRQAKGDYVGLTYPAEGAIHDDSCYLYLKMGDTGGISGHMILGGRKRSVAGSVGLDGQASVVLQKVTDKNGNYHDWQYGPTYGWEYKGSAYLFDLQAMPGTVWGWLERRPELLLYGVPGHS